MNNHFVAFLNTNGVFLLLLFVIFYFIFAKKNISEAFRIGSAAIVAAIVAIVLKELFVTPRPFLASGLEKQAGLAYLSSFPSLHSAVAFALATSVSYRQKVFGVFLIGLAFAIGVGRVYANVHYPQDVFVGIVIGVVIALFIEKYHSR